ncbi:putative Mn2+ efflux pump MntP [Tamilnaduibacter salinus]|uniref:Putative manganese efflux pump MntP n=2 Tax=Tamilnaduibacter salinus TaxID=1484056 RepID=A0A2U1CY15_9GAMM|nr:putative Mn2+ efflux pump MntP [Tamilnaduibacter salinus]
MGQPHPLHALRRGLVFGVVETIAPLVGWTLGMGAAQYVDTWDHWIVFSLLLLIGGHMMYASFAADGEGRSSAATRHRRGWWLLLATAFATSIDALAVGVGLALMDVNIVTTALAIGAATTLMATLGTLFGRWLTDRVGRPVEFLGGLILIGIGSGILTQHLGLW